MVNTNKHKNPTDMSEGTIVDGRQGSGLVLWLKQNNSMHTTTHEHQQIIEQHAQELTPQEFSICKHDTRDATMDPHHWDY